MGVYIFVLLPYSYTTRGPVLFAPVSCLSPRSCFDGVNNHINDKCLIKVELIGWNTSDKVKAVVRILVPKYGILKITPSGLKCHCLILAQILFFFKSYTYIEVQDQVK